MIRFRQIAVTALAALALTSCMEGSESASAVKGTLEGKGYTVSVYNAEQYKTLSTAQVFTEAKNLKDHLTAAKAETKDTFFAWFFADINSASTWFDENMSTFGRIFTGASGDMAVGLKNNVAYLGTKAAQSAVGWAIQA